MNVSLIKLGHCTVLFRGSIPTKFIIRCIGTEKQILPPSSKSSTSEPKKLKITPIPPPSGSSDSVGPPDSVSNIRPIRFYIPADETLTEKQFRLKREEVLEWNKKFWADHNSRFFQEKEKYTQDNQTKDSNGNVQQLSPEEMAIFYRKFLNHNWNSHIHYNKEWYKKNISLLWPAFKVTLIRLRRKLAKKS